MTANGGTGGGANASPNGGAGGSASGGQVNLAGGQGGAGGTSTGGLVEQLLTVVAQQVLVSGSQEPGSSPEAEALAVALKLHSLALLAAVARSIFGIKERLLCRLSGRLFYVLVMEKTQEEGQPASCDDDATI